MAMTVSSNAPLQYSDDAAMRALLDRLKEQYPDLSTKQYDKIAQVEVTLSSEIEAYVRAWFEDLCDRGDFQAQSGEISEPLFSDAAEMEQNMQALALDDPWVIAKVVDMPDELREAFIKELEKTTGETYEKHFAKVKTEKDGTAAVAMGSLFDNNKNTDVHSVLSHFPSNSLPGKLFGFLGSNQLLARNIQTRSALAIAEIDQEEHRIMAELAGLGTMGLSPDDPKYQTKLKELELEMGDLRASKEQYMAFITKSENAVQELMELFSSFIKQFNEHQQQLAANTRLAA